MVEACGRGNLFTSWRLGLTDWGEQKAGILNDLTSSRPCFLQVLPHPSSADTHASGTGVAFSHGSTPLPPPRP